MLTSSKNFRLARLQRRALSTNGAAAGAIEVVVVAVGVGLQCALPSGEMPVEMGLLAKPS
jgi:hypothetical protein